MSSVALSVDACRAGRRENGPIETAAVSSAVAVPPSSEDPSVPGSALRARLAVLGIVLVLGSLLLLLLDAAAAPTDYVPASTGGWPNWLSGPLHGIGSELHGAGFETLMLVMCAGYLLVIAGARRLPLPLLAGSIVLAHLLLVLGPPMISQDVFGYLAFARMGALHGLDPYTHVAAEASSDPVFAFVGWPFKHSPYGPIYTLASYGAAPLGAAGGLWAMKIVAALAGLGAVALSAGAASRLGRSSGEAAAFIGLNPVLLVLAVGGAHNDTLLILLLSLALFVTAGANPSYRAGAWALAVAVGVKVTAGIALPFLVLAPPERARRAAVALAAVLGLLVVAAIGVIGFGPHALGFFGAVGEQQRLIATHSIPAETARLFSLAGTPGWWRGLFWAGFLTVLLTCLWRTARGGDWRDGTAWSTLALLASTAWLLPWYAIWALPLAAVSGDRRLRAAVLLACAYAVLIHLPLAAELLSPRG